MRNLSCLCRNIRRSGTLFKPTARCHTLRPRQLFTWSASIQHHIDNMNHEYKNITEKLMMPDELSKSEMKKFSSEMNQLRPIMEAYHHLLKKKEELLEVAALAIDDMEFEKLAEDEMKELRQQIQQRESELIEMVIPSDLDDENNAVLEVRAGTGGREAAIFALEIFNMYKKFSSSNRWSFDIVSESVNAEGGLKEASATINGNSVFAFMKHEIGVHRVQRIPVTESQGRVHTSTISVAVLPQPENVGFVLDMKDVKIDTFKSSGAGGQHVNTTDSAVRVTHLPTGMTVSMQDGRSQIMNRQKALQVLSAKLYDEERTRAMKERSDARRIQIGSALRSERIRTYNYPQDRITDHRIGLTLHGVEDLLNGGSNLHELIDSLKAHEKLLSLENLSNLKPVVRL
eukprot:TCONS_00051582-protein